MARFCNFQCIIVRMLILIEFVLLFTCRFTTSRPSNCLYTSKDMKPIHDVVMINIHTLQHYSSAYRNLNINVTRNARYLLANAIHMHTARYVSCLAHSSMCLLPKQFLETY